METLERIISAQKKDWEINPIKENTYSADDLIDAYFKGKIEGMNNEKQLRYDKLQANLEKAQELSEDIYEKVKQLGFTCDKVYLKVKNIYSYKALFIIPEDDYCDDSFMDVYSMTIKVKKEVNNSNVFDFSTILTANNESLDSDTLLADGYILSYVGVQ